MEIFETIILVLCYLFSIGMFVCLLFLCWKIVPLLYRALVANVKIVEKKAEKIDDDDETITII